MWQPDSDIREFIETDRKIAESRPEVNYENCPAHIWALEFADQNPEARLEDLFKAVKELDDIHVCFWAMVVLEQHHENLWPEGRSHIIDILGMNPTPGNFMVYEHIKHLLTVEERVRVLSAIRDNIDRNLYPAAYYRAKDILMEM